MDIFRLLRNAYAYFGMLILADVTTVSWRQQILTVPPNFVHPPNLHSEPKYCNFCVYFLQKIDAWIFSKHLRLFNVLPSFSISANIYNHTEVCKRYFMPKWYRQNSHQKSITEKTHESLRNKFQFTRILREILSFQCFTLCIFILFHLIFGFFILIVKYRFGAPKPVGKARQHLTLFSKTRI